MRIIALFLTLVALPLNAQTLVDPQIQVQVVVSGLTGPTQMVFINTNDLFVLEKDFGQVRRVTDGVLQTNPVLDVAVDNSDERGLLGIALHPGFATNHFVYLCYTESATPGVDTVFEDPLCICIVRYEWDGSILTNAMPIFSFPVEPFIDYHNGGVITFGPDGKLYAVTGDHERFGQLQNDTTGAAPDDTSVIVRLNDDGSVPSDNPFFGLGGNLAKYYAYGIRNSFGLAFDPVSGSLWDSENGDFDYDEINLVAPGFNSGWREIMGPLSRTPGGTNNLVVFTGSQYADPKFSWVNTVAPTGLLFFDSTELGNKYRNDLFVGDFNNGNLYWLPVNNARTGFNLTDLIVDSNAELNTVTLGTGFGAISDLKIGPDGRLYILSIENGTIYALFRQPGGPHHDLAVTKLNAKKTIALTSTVTNRIGKVKVTIQNRSNHSESITASNVAGLVTLAVNPMLACPAPHQTLFKPTLFPIPLDSKKKLTLTYLVTYDCPGVFTNVATVFHTAIDGEADLHPNDDVCPHGPLGIDPNPDSSINDKGCGGRNLDRTLGAPVLTNVIQK